MIGAQAFQSPSASEGWLNPHASSETLAGARALTDLRYSMSACLE
jgi:hypothetical protein